MASKKRIEDFGAKIGGARKDFYTRLPTAAEISEMSPIERGKNICKANVWPAPDYEGIVANGVGVGVAYLTKMIRDSIPPFLKDNYLSAATRNGVALEDVYEEYAASIGVIRDAVQGVLAGELSNSIRFELLQSEMEKAAKAVRTDTRRDYYNPLLCSAVTNVLSISNYDLEKAARLALRKNWPDTSPVSKLIKKWILEPIEDEGALRDKKWIVRVRYAPQSSANKVFLEDLSRERFETPQEAAVAIRLKVAEFLAKLRQIKAESEPEVRPQLDRVERKGLPDHRKNRDVTEVDFQEAFGFRGGEFGNWMSQEDRRQTLNHAYDALWDLSEALEIPPKAISMEGRLAIAFGARGHGGKTAAAAHYEPGRKVMNFTKPNGAGCVAHEWFHALDHALGDIGGAGESNPRNPFLVSNLGKINTYGIEAKIGAEKTKAIHGLLIGLDKMLHAQISTKATQAEAVAYRQDEFDSVCKCINAWFHGTQYESKLKVEGVSDSQMDAWVKLRESVESGVGGHSSFARMDFILRSNLGSKEGFDTRTKKAMRTNLSIKETRLNHLDIAKSGAANLTIKTKLWNSLKKLDSTKAKPYWTQPIEMAARAFECFVNDTVCSASQGAARSDYLVHGTGNQEIYLTGDLRKSVGEIWKDIVPHFHAIYGKLERKVERAVVVKPETAAVTPEVSKPTKKLAATEPAPRRGKSSTQATNLDAFADLGEFLSQFPQDGDDQIAASVKF